MAKPKETDSAPPTSFPSTPPPPTADVSGWLFNASAKVENSLGRFEGTLVGFQTQLNRMEAKLGEVETEVRGIGKWIHTLKIFSLVVVSMIGWAFVNALWPWLKTKLGIP